MKRRLIIKNENKSYIYKETKNFFHNKNKISIVLRKLIL